MSSKDFIDRLLRGQICHDQAAARATPAAAPRPDLAISGLLWDRFSSAAERAEADEGYPEQGQTGRFGDSCTRDGEGGVESRGRIAVDDIGADAQPIWEYPSIAFIASPTLQVSKPQWEGDRPLPR